MIPNPIHKVLSTMHSRQVRCLLMGGQACVLYGAAEFSRDTDIAVLADSHNFECLLSAIADLQAECIAVPPPQLIYLQNGHALHFRCHHQDVEGMRIDVMSKMRGLDEFHELWNRRTTIELEDGFAVDLLCVSDLVQAKKTQRDKDWPMIRRLLENHYLQNRNDPSSERVRFWLLEMRTPILLEEVVKQYPAEATKLATRRTALSAALRQDNALLNNMLLKEETEEREKDRLYWEPLRRELESLRHEG